MWYHLSLKSEGLEPGIGSLREPEKAFGETKEDCFCVSPIVWQCALSVPQKGRMFIFKVDVWNPKPVDDSVRDRNYTEEHRITEEVLAEEDGFIPLKLVGSIEITDELKTYLKVAFIGMGRKCSAKEEKQTLWSISNREWNVRYEDPVQLREVLENAAN